MTATVTSSGPGGQTAVAVTTTSETVTSQISPNLTSTISAIIAGTETVPQLSRTLFASEASTASPASQTGATSTGSSSSGGETGSSSTRENLTGGQIGGISAGAVVGFLLLVALGWLLVRNLIRISRFMDKFNNHAPRAEQPMFQGGGEDKKDADLEILDDGNGANGQLPSELSPQERPQLLDEWGRHGSRGNELSGSQDAHGISELDGTSVVR